MARDAPRSSRSPLWIVACFVGGIIVVFMGISFAQEVRRRLALQRHVSALQQEIHEREQRIGNLEQLTEYLKTDAYRERAAREKLSYQRPDEHVIVVPESEVPRGGESAAREAVQASLSVPRQWWDHLFGVTGP